MARCRCNGVQHRPLVDSSREGENVGLIHTTYSIQIAVSMHDNIIHGAEKGLKIDFCAGGTTTSIMES